MKKQLQEMINNLEDFLKGMTSINNNPYSLGLDDKRLLADLQEYTIGLNELVSQLPNDETKKNDKKEQNK